VPVPVDDAAHRGIVPREEAAVDPDRRHCPGRKPPFSAVKRPARPYKSPIQNRFTQENANGA
jgi:hypothetical protein